MEYRTDPGPRILAELYETQAQTYPPPGLDPEVWGSLPIATQDAISEWVAELQLQSRQRGRAAGLLEASRILLASR